MIVKIFSFVLCTLFLIVILKSFRSDLSVLVSLATSVILISSALVFLKPVVTFMISLSDSVDFNSSYFEILLKCCAISFLGGLTSELCRDNGQGALAQSSDIICKCTLISLTLPIYKDVFNWIVKLWEKV